MACHACDGAHLIVAVPVGGEALCQRCGSLLYANRPHSLDRATALYVAAFILFMLANVFPFIALKFGDRVEQSLLISGGLALQKAGMPEIGLLVLLTSVIFPFLTICAMLYLLVPLRLGFTPRWKTPVWRFVRAISPWSLMGVFMLGLLVSVLKLQDLAAIVPGVAFYSFIGLFADKDLPAWLENALKLMVLAIFASIVFSSVVMVGGEVAGLTYWPRYAAASIGLVAAILSRGNMLVTVLVGMAALHGLPWLLR